MARHRGSHRQGSSRCTESTSRASARCPGGALLAGAGAVGIGAAAGPLAFAGRASAAGAGDDPYSVDVISKGADPTGARPSDDAFQRAAADVLASFQSAPISGAIPKLAIVIPPGYHQVAAASTPMTAGKLLYDGCRFINQAAGTGGSGFLRWTGATPRYEFRDCLAGAVYLTDAKGG